jgi:hypothetical protein
VYVFSSAKLTLSDRRARLQSEIVEALQCLHHWDVASMLVAWDSTYGDRRGVAK